MLKLLTLKEMQDLELEILKDFHQFCVSHNLTYSLDGGTLIGAIRHKGFIPWDDDVDVVMPRPDYDRLCATYQSDSFRLKCFENDNNCSIGFARIYDYNRTGFKTLLPWCKDKKVGLWIDIFPADGAPDEDAKLNKLYQEVLRLRSQTLEMRFTKSPFFFEKGLRYNLALLKRKLLTRNAKGLADCTRKLISTAKTYEFGSTSRFASFTIIGKPTEHTHCSMKAWDHSLLVDFEDTQLYVMEGYDEFLRVFFGDYMQLPPPEERVPKQQSYIKFYWL